MGTSTHAGMVQTTGSGGAMGERKEKNSAWTRARSMNERCSHIQPNVLCVKKPTIKPIPVPTDACMVNTRTASMHLCFVLAVVRIIKRKVMILPATNIPVPTRCVRQMVVSVFW